MHIKRKQDLSVIYWLKNLLESNSVNVVDGYPADGFTVPCVAVEWKDIDSFQVQLGSSDREYIRSWYFDVFALNRTQKDEIVFSLLDQLENYIDVYDYDVGFPPTEAPKIGVLSVIATKANNIQVFPELTNKMYHRATITFVTQYETVGGI